MSTPPRVLFVSYGGGHVEMCLPVMHALRTEVPDCQVQILALTTAAAIAKRAGEHPLGFHDFCTGEWGERALRYGAQMLDGKQHPDITAKESQAYLGMNFLEWVEEVGEQNAWLRWKESGRKNFHPTRVMQRILKTIKPDLVVTTNSPRSEQAAVEAAIQLHIPTLTMVDLFALQGDTYLHRSCYADRITVLAESTRHNLLAAGIPDDRIVVTGNPAFDSLNAPSSRKAGADLRASLGWEQQFVVLWAGHLEPADAPLNWAGTALGHAVQEQLVDWVLAHEEVCLAIRYHPNEWHHFTPPKKHARIHWSHPGSDALMPVLSAADAVVVQATTVGAQAFVAGKQVLGLAFSPLVQRSRMNYSQLGMGIEVPSMDGLCPLLSQQLIADRHRADAHPLPCSAASQIAHEIADMLMSPRNEGLGV